MQEVGYVIHKWEKPQSIETNSFIIQMTALVDLDIKALIITIFQLFKKLKDILSMLCRDRIFLKAYTELLDKKILLDEKYNG